MTYDREVIFSPIWMAKKEEKIGEKEEARVKLCMSTSAFDDEYVNGIYTRRRETFFLKINHAELGKANACKPTRNRDFY